MSLFLSAGLISRMKILITGATGLIGRSVCRSLINEGHQVVVLSRRPPAIGLAGVSAFRWEPVAESPAAAGWEGVEAVIHLAGSLWPPQDGLRNRSAASVIRA